MTDIKQGDYVEWRHGRAVYKVETILKTDDPANDKVSISRQVDESKRRVYTVFATEVKAISSELAEKVSSINDAIQKEKNQSAERLVSLQRQLDDVWDLIHKVGEKSL